MLRHVVAVLILTLPGVALATGVDEACQDIADQKPVDYNEQRQQVFLSNYYALVSSFSATHGPIPHEPGRGMIGVRLQGMPPLPCKRRFALDWSKTEDTNKTPVVPTITASFAFPKLGPLHPYAEAGYFPPVTLLGTRNVILQGALGVGVEAGPMQIGARYHATMQKTIGDIATPEEEGQPSYVDLYLASTLGFDVSAGMPLGPVTPFVSVGYLDASTFFYVDDTPAIANNYFPYSGMAISIGADGLYKDRIRYGIEYYGAPGGHRVLDEDQLADGGYAQYGRLHTIRARVGLEL